MLSAIRAFDEERFKKTVAVIIAVVALISAMIALMQSDASARDDRANRDTKDYATKVLGLKVSGDARVNFDYNSVYQAWYELDTLASSAEARGDAKAAARYIDLRDRTTRLSPLLAAPYFDPAKGGPDLARYESDTYIVEMTVLNEKFISASSVKDAWDAKSNAYIFHLTLLAVSFFLLGLSITIANSFTRWIFSVVGVVVAIMTIGMALEVWQRPVPDLRDKNQAIESYAKGMGMAHQGRWDEAIASFDESIKIVPDYTSVYVERARAYSSKNDLAKMIADFEKARDLGNESSNVAGELAWAYYLQGRMDDAVAMNRTALKTTPNELWIQFDLGLALLASGKIDDAKAEYTKGMDIAAKQVADAKAAGQEVPSFVWWGLDDAAVSINGLMETAAVTDTSATQPPRDKIADPKTIVPVGEALKIQVKSLAVGLEYAGKPPEGGVTAKISPFVFGMREDPTDPEAEPVIADSFPNGTQEVLVFFDYENMKDGQEVLFKVYIDGEEDPSWRIIAPWDLGASGSAEKPLSLAYSDVFILTPGAYTVEIYVNSNLVQQGTFVVEE